jgi:hypothetical protein
MVIVAGFGDIEGKKEGFGGNLVFRIAYPITQDESCQNLKSS